MSCFSEIKSALTSSHGRSSLADTDDERAAMSSKRQREKQEVHDRSRIISSDCKHPFLRCLEPQILCTMPRSERACGFVWCTCLSHKTNKADSISAFSFQNKFPVTYKMTFFFKYVAYNKVSILANIFFTFLCRPSLYRCVFHWQGTVHAFSVKAPARSQF